MRGSIYAMGLGMRAFFGATLVAALVMATPAIADSGPRVYESAHDDEITEGEITIDLAPDQAYAIASDYQKWTAIFPEIVRVTVTQQVGVDARVSLDYKDHRNNLHFHNDPKAHRVWFENTHSRADMWAELVFYPGATPNSSRVHARIYADVPGAAGVFVSERTLRHARTDRLRSDLGNVSRYFAR